MFTATIYGTPVPQGSKSATVRGGRAVMFEANKAHKNWREKVTWELSNQRTNNGIEPYNRDDALYITVGFYMPRPKTNKRAYPTTKPDGDKLLRSICDSVVASGLVPDDSQFVEYHVYLYYDADPRVFVTIGKK